MLPKMARYALSWGSGTHFDDPTFIGKFGFGRPNASARDMRPRLRNGWTLVFEEPIRFTDGSAHERMEVVIEPGRPRSVRFRPVGGRGLYQIGNLDRLRYELELTA